MTRDLADHEIKNRNYWGSMADQWVEPGRRNWSTREITWGIWNLPETTLQAFGPGFDFSGKDVIEMGCGTAYFSAWISKAGGKPVGVDITPNQLETARNFQKEFGLDFPLIEASAEAVPLPDASFDVAFSEYGASIWCDPEKWIAEASRLLRPGGLLVFMRNGTLSMICTGASGPVQTTLQRDWFNLKRLEWDDDDSVEFHLTPGAMIRVLRKNGFKVEDLIDIQAPADAPETRFEYMNKAWARQWPSEEIWRARKRF